MAAPAAPGLPSLTTGVITEAGTSFSSLDSFAAAITAAETVGATISAFVCSPPEALALAKLRQATGSNVPLLGADVTSPTSRSIFGVPLYVSPFVGPKVVWAIPGDRVMVVVRADAKVEADSSVYFTSDRVAVRATMRVGFAYPHALAIQKISHA